jgi:Zn finger protein HypA/HybF involved in hydrogenase expression
MASQREFECLRCEHRFQAEYDSRQVVERTCPKCASNSVRLAPVAKAAAGAKPA